MRQTMRWTLATLLGVFVLAGLTLAGSEKIAPDKLPKAVVDALKSKYPGAEIRGASKEIEDGKTSYEVYTKFKGKGLDVTFSPAGVVEIVEKEIDAKELPAVVRAAVDKKYPQVTFTKVEEISKAKDGKMVVNVFEILFTTTAKKTVEMTIAPDGKVTGEADKTPASKKDAKDK